MNIAVDKGLMAIRSKRLTPEVINIIKRMLKLADTMKITYNKSMLPLHLYETVVDKNKTDNIAREIMNIGDFELLQSQILENELILPEEKGLHLNPSLSFLNLEFDVGMMMDEATKGSVQILQRPHVLCLYSHPTRGLHNIEVTTPILETLQLLEEDSLENREAVPKHLQETLQKLIDLGVIVEITN